MIECDKCKHREVCKHTEPAETANRDEKAYNESIAAINPPFWSRMSCSQLSHKGIR